MAIAVLGVDIHALAFQMITVQQVRAARAMLGIDQRKLAKLAGLSLPTIQRMEASDGLIRGTVDSLMKLVGALDAAGIVLIGEDAASAEGGRGIRLKKKQTAAAKPARKRPVRRPPKRARKAAKR